jgi:hypothetical protein
MKEKRKKRKEKR